MIYFYSTIKPGPNRSQSPSGLIKWILDVLKRHTKIKEINCFNPDITNSLIIIYPSENIKKIPKNFLSNNKVIVVGPDCAAIEIINLLKIRIPKIKFLFEIKIVNLFFYLIFDFIFEKYNFKKLVVGREDYKFLDKFEKSVFYLPHPFISSLERKHPLKSFPEEYVGLVIIGKLRGMPVAFKNIEKYLNKYLIPLLYRNKNVHIFLFESTKLKLKKFPRNRITSISPNAPLENDFFRSKIILNLSVCGAGTANRSLSALFDGGYLFTTKFGSRNIDQDKFVNQIFISKSSPFKKSFYDDLETFLYNIVPADNTLYIKEYNQFCENKLIKYTEFEK